VYGRAHSLPVLVGDKNLRRRCAALVDLEILIVYNLNMQTNNTQPHRTTRTLLHSTLQYGSCRSTLQLQVRDALVRQM
jgi:hypothetical protein